MHVNQQHASRTPLVLTGTTMNSCTTLKAKKIMNHAVVNEDATASMIRNLREELEQLRSQVQCMLYKVLDSAQ